MPLSGYATETGTQRYHRRFPDSHPTHARQLGSCLASSIGAGTYLGDPDEATDQRYAEALETVLACGGNLLDTAINYRCQRAERTIGATLARLAQQGAIRRDEVFLCTKGGYLPFDDDVPDDPQRYLADTFITSGLVPYDELVAGCHCLAPDYLDAQLATSLRNLGVETIDLYYLHNPEQQLDQVSHDVFLKRIEAAFQRLEQRVADGRIRGYGTATWNGYRVSPQARPYLSLAELVGIARRVVGAEHHFRAIQLPYNLAMPEAYAFPNQIVDGVSMSVLEAAARLDITVIASASLLQSRLAALPATLDRWLPRSDSDAQRAIQFVRSTPGITTALVGMQRAAHARENLALARLPAWNAEQIDELFTHQRS